MYNEPLSEAERRELYTKSRRKANIRRGFLIFGLLVCVALSVLPLFLFTLEDAKPNHAGPAFDALTSYSSYLRTGKTKDGDNPDALKASFSLVTTHTGSAWYVRTETDGTCWVLDTNPTPPYPSKADASVCASGIPATGAPVPTP